VRTRAFLDALFSTCSGGVVEFRALPSGKREWASPGTWDLLGPFITEQVRAGQNVTLGVATRRDTTSGTTANLRELPAVFVDLDRPPEKARRRLDLLPFPPSWIISSGRHIHAYYRLKEPADLSSVDERKRAGSVLRRLAAHLTGDLGATDTARVLRLPGTLSFKYADPLPVTVLETTATVINLSELDDWLPAEVVRAGVRVLDNRLREGHRNDALHALLRSLKHRGLPFPVIADVIQVVNAGWCCPPLEHAELRRTFEHAMVQADAPEFLARHATDIVHDADEVEPCG